MMKLVFILIVFILMVATIKESAPVNSISKAVKQSCKDICK